MTQTRDPGMYKSLVNPILLSQAVYTDLLRVVLDPTNLLSIQIFEVAIMFSFFVKNLCCDGSNRERVRLVSTPVF